MSLQSKVVSQFRRPTGPLGRLAGWTMANRPSNRERNRCTIEYLDVQPHDRVLEIGYGPGLGIERVSERLRDGKVIGLDHSVEMFRQAARRNAAGIAAGKIELRVGDVLDPPSPLPHVNKIYSVNVVQFWPAPTRVFAALKRLLEPGGLIVTTYMPRSGDHKRDQALAWSRKVERIMAETGLTACATHWLEFATPAFCIVARDPVSRSA